MPDSYTDLLLRIFPYKTEKQSYPVEAELDDGSRFTDGQLKLDQEQLRGLHLNAEGYGLALFNALFAPGGDIRRAYDKATGAAEASTGGRLRVRLWVDEGAVELHALPWERLYHLHLGKTVPLGASALTPLSRYTSLEIREPLPITETPLRLLVVVANPLNLPGNLAPANVDLEIENLRRAVSDLRRQNQIQVTILPGRTGLSPALRAKLEAEGYAIVEGVTNLFNMAPHLSKAHIFHFIGHGAFRKAASPAPGEGQGGGTAALYLEKADGSWQAVKDEEITSMFVALGALPHLVFLVACESATRDPGAVSPFVGLGPKLVQAGIPAVVAMQDQVPVELARTLAGEFYARLAEHGEVDRALNQARLQVFNAKSIEWAIPVLFMRIRKGKLFGADLEADAPAPGEPPYKGLAYFTEKDAGKFYGRETLTAKLIGKLRQSRFLPVIIGASGSGKSSVIRAGVVPALRRGEPLADGSLPPEGSASWPIYIVTPTAQPLDSLAAALTRDAESTRATTTLMDDMAVDPRALHLHALKRVSQNANTNRLLLIIDQFEEIFTLCKDEAERKAFVDNLLFAAAESTAGPTIVIIIFRADFYAHCGQYENLRVAVSTNQEFVGPMSRDELRRAIEEPAKAGGWDLEPGLSDLLLKEVGDEPGALPLLQHALLETWKRRRARTLTLRGYNDAGGIRGAIAKTAEAIYAALPEPEQPIARRIFLRLVELGEGTQDTRRRARLEELYPRAEDKPAVEAVVQKLVDNRLIVTTDKTAEVAHEALIREWPSLRQWISDSREALRVHRELLGAAEDWERVKRDSGALYRGVRLMQAQEWARVNLAELGPLEQAFLAQSQATAEEETRRELENARKIAEAAQRAQEAAEKQRADERFQQALVAQAGKLASTALALPATQLDRALLLSAEATAMHASASSLGSLLTTLEKTQKLAMCLHGHTATITALAFHPENPVLASGAANGEVFLWDLRATATGPQKLDGHNSLVLTLAFSPDGTKLISTDWEQSTIIVWDAATGKKLVETELAGSGLCLAFTPKGERLLVGQANGSISYVNPETLETASTLEAHDGQVTSLAFNPEGTRFVSGDGQGVMRQWIFKTGKQSGQDMKAIGEVLALAYDLGGDYFAAGTSERTVEVWKLTTQERLTFSPLDPLSRVRCLRYRREKELVYVSSANDLTLWNYAGSKTGESNSGTLSLLLRGLEGAVDAAALSANGALLASSAGHTIFMWQAQDASPLGKGMTTEHRIKAVAVRPDGQVIAMGTTDGKLTLLDAATLDQLDNFKAAAEEVGLTDVAFSRDGQWLALNTSAGEVNLFNPTTNQVRLLTTHDSPTGAVAFSPDGQWLAVAAGSAGVRVWAWAQGETEVVAYTIEGITAVDVIFSPDSQLLAIATAASNVGLYNALTGEQLGEPLRGHTDIIWSVEFSPDGKLLASGSRDFTIGLWDVERRVRLTTLAGSTDEVRCVAFSANGLWLVSTGDEGAVRVWDMQTFQPVGAPLLCHFDNTGYGEGYRVVFAPNAPWFVSCGTKPFGFNQRNLDMEGLRDQARALAGRELTHEEWSIYSPEIQPTPKTEPK